MPEIPAEFIIPADPSYSHELRHAARLEPAAKPHRPILLGSMILHQYMLA